MQATETILVRSSFGPSLGYRYRSQGDHSGEEFREKYLDPIVKKDNIVIFDFDGIYSFPSSFLDEAFGEFYRKYGTEQSRKIEIRADHYPEIVTEILGYMK